MSDREELNLAARRLVEFETIERKLVEAAAAVANSEDACTLQYETTYAGTRRTKHLLNEVEWECYQYASLIHMLGEMIDRTHDEFGTRLRNHTEVRHELPKLVGIRHAIHHNGLVGLNIVQLRSEPYVVVPTTSVEKHGNWGEDGNPSFQTFFHSAGDLITIGPLATNSKKTVRSLVKDIIGAVEEQFDPERLRQRVSEVEIYTH